MVLRNVATSFTIEQQRVEINELAGDVDDILTGTTTVPGSFNALVADVAGEAATLSAGATGADLTLSGNLTVNGTQTILNTETLEVEDKNIVLCKDGITDAAANGGGITLFGNSAKTILYLSSGNKWISNIAFEIESHLEVAGTCEATLFDGNGTNLTDLPAAQLTGALPAIDGSALTGIAAGATIADAGNANANRTILFSANASGSNQTLTTDGGLLYNAAEDALKVNGTIITAGGITGAGSSCVVAAANHSSTCSITVGSAITMAGEVSDSKGKLRSIPSNPKSIAYVAVASDAGKAIHITTGGVTININVFAAGDAVTIINNSGSDQTITAGASLTMYQAGDSGTGNRTLAGRGIATIWFAAPNQCYISGAGLS